MRTDGRVVEWDALEADPSWPPFARARPQAVVLFAVAVIVVAWVLMVAIDLFNVAGVGEATHQPAWYHLFNNRPVEWMQWLLLAWAVLLYGFLSGRLYDTPDAGAGLFFLFLGAGLGLMLIEEAGDVRHVISEYVRSHVGAAIFGTSFRVVSDLPYFAALAALPIYAVLRFGRFVWRAPIVRPYLISGVALYGLAAIGSGLRHHHRMYRRLGRWIDESLMGGRWPAQPGQSEGSAHHYVVDGPLEETIELLAAASLLAVGLAFATYLRNRPMGERQPGTPG